MKIKNEKYYFMGYSCDSNVMYSFITINNKDLKRLKKQALESLQTFVEEIDDDFDNVVLRDEDEEFNELDVTIRDILHGMLLNFPNFFLEDTYEAVTQKIMSLQVLLHFYDTKCVTMQNPNDGIKHTYCFEMCECKEEDEVQTAKNFYLFVREKLIEKGNNLKPFDIKFI